MSLEIQLLLLLFVTDIWGGNSIGGGGFGGGGVGGGANTYIQLFLTASGDKIGLTKGPQSQNAEGSAISKEETTQAIIEPKLPFKNYTRGFFENSKYVFVMEPKFNWNGARNACAQIGMVLASIESIKEKNYLINLLIDSGIGEDYSASAVYLGGRRTGDSQLTWLDNDKAIPKFLWSSAEPSNAKKDGSKDCVIISMYQVARGENGGKMCRCDLRHAFICKTKETKFILA